MAASKSATRWTCSTGAKISASGSATPVASYTPGETNAPLRPASPPKLRIGVAPAASICATARRAFAAARSEIIGPI